MRLVGVVCILLVAALVAGCADKPQGQSLVSSAPTTTQPTTAGPPSSSENPLSFTENLPTVPDIPGVDAAGVLVAGLLAAGIALVRRHE